MPRYKIVLLLGFFLLVVWASTGKKEVEPEMESPPLPSKHQMPEKAGDGGREFLDFDYKYDRRKSEKGKDDVRNVKEEVARVVAQARVGHDKIKENLILDSTNREKPKQDLRSQGGGKMLVTRRRQDTLNGVLLPAEPAGKIPWQPVCNDGNFMDKNGTKFNLFSICCVYVSCLSFATL